MSTPARYMHRLVPLAALVTAHAMNAGAQTANAVGSFKTGYTDIGPTIGLGGIGSAGLAFGGRFERAIKRLPDLGDGVLGIEASVDYWSYNERFLTADFGFSYIAIGGTANYHFQIKSNPRVDPFIGVGLGILNLSTEYTGPTSSGVYFIGRAGVRYFLKPRMALYADAGAGASSINVGVTFGMAGGK